MPKNQTVADIGCGSGHFIYRGLSCWEQKKSLWGRYRRFSDQKLAVATAQLNQMDRDKIVVRDGGIEKLIEEEVTFDGITCNILADTIVELFPQFNQITHEKKLGSLKRNFINSGPIALPIL